MKRPSENGIRIFQTAWKGIDMSPLARNLALIALPPQVAGFVLLVILLGGDFPDFILGIGTLAVLGLLVASILYCLPITVPYAALLSILKPKPNSCYQPGSRTAFHPEGTARLGGGGCFRRTARRAGGVGCRLGRIFVSRLYPVGYAVAHCRHLRLYRPADVAVPA